MLSNGGLSASDVLALSDNNSDGFGGGNAWWVIILFALIFGWGNGGFGSSTTASNVATESSVQRGFDNQNVMMRFDTIGQNLTNSTYENAQLINGVNVSMLQSNVNTINAMNNGFNGVGQTLNTGFDTVNANINNLAHQMEQCCCQIKTQLLQDKYDQAQNQLNLAEISSANAVQTQNLLGNLGKWIPYYPYTTYGTTSIA